MEERALSLGRKRGESIGLSQEDKKVLAEDNGVVPHVVCQAECWVVAEGWPSWSYVLRSLGCKDIYTVVKGLSLGELLEVRATGLDPSRIHSWTHIEKLLAMKSASPRHLWIQGSREFISQVLKIAKLFNIMDYTCVAVEAKGLTGKLPPVEGIDWVQLNHHRLGGLTHGKYRVLTSSLLDKKFLYKPSPVRLRLKHILRGTEPGIKMGPTQVSSLLQSKSCISGDSLVKTGTAKVRVLAPSVFHGSEGVVQRYLSAQELMDVYDVDVGVQDMLLNYSKTRNQKPLNTFVNQVPGKVLYRLALAVFQPTLLRSPGTSMSRGPAQESVDITRSLGEGSRGKNQDVPGAMPTDEPRKVNMATPSEEEVDLPGSRVSVDDDNVKATKNDDAKANASEWNVRAGSRFPGGYSPQKHDPMLELYRDACLRWYTNRVRKSFTSYLTVTYGENWYELAHGRSPSYAGKKRKREAESAVSISLESLGCDVDVQLATSASQIGDNRDEDSDPIMGREAFVAMLSDTNSEGLKLNGDERKRKELLKDLKVGRDAIRRAGLSSWWEWDAGSTLLFWRWPEEYKKDVRDGLEVCVEGQLPEYWAKQRWPENPKEREQLRKKLFKPVSKRYIA